jgi:hypothetical protein
MKPKTILAIILITCGIAAFVYQGLIFMNGGEERSRKHVLPLLPIFGAIALIGGIAWLLVDKNDFKPTVMP